MNEIKDCPGSGSSISQLLQALDKAVDDSMTEARRYSRHRLDSVAPRRILTRPSIQDGLQHERGLSPILYLNSTSN